MTTGQTKALTRRTFVGKVMSLLFNMLSAAAAKLLQSCLALCDPIDNNPPGSSIHGIFQKTKIVASGLITPWEIDGETVETVTDFILGGFRITADGDYIMKLKDTCPLEKSYEQPR